MCGLYSFRRAPEEARNLFGYVEQANFPPRPTIAPTEPIAIVRRQGFERHLALVRWGLVPGWTKEPKPGRPCINARAETVLTKPFFRNAMRRRRCLVPADGFYEWRGAPGRKQAFLLHRPNHELFAFAGLWEYWMAPDGSEIETAAIITTDANADVRPIHERMPVIIDPDDFDTWLDCERVTATEAAKLLRPAPDGTFTSEPTVIERPRRSLPRPPEGAARQPKLL